MIHPTIPPSILIGVDKLKRIKIYPLPPQDIVYSSIGEYHEWYGAKTCHQCNFFYDSPDSYGQSIDCGFPRPKQLLPYSIRSLIIQLGLKTEFPCKLFIRSVNIDEYNNIIFDEGCITRCGGSIPELNQCDIISGGGASGKLECPGYLYIKNSIFESPREEMFFQFWLRINAGKETPALLPQAYVDPLQERRPDFTLFIPRESGKFDWHIIELDGPSYHMDIQKEKERDKFLNKQGYDIIHVPTTANILKEVRKIYSQLLL